MPNAAAARRMCRCPRPSASASASRDAEVLKLAGDAIAIEDHYSKSAGHPVPMDIEWAKDGDDGQLYIIQARPETVVSRRAPTGFETYALEAPRHRAGDGARGRREDRGRSCAGHRRCACTSQSSSPAKSSSPTRPRPDWEPVMKIAAAIVTERGGRTCHAAIVARELGIPAVVGAEGANEHLMTGTSRDRVLRRGRNRPRL